MTLNEWWELVHNIIVFDNTEGLVLWSLGASHGYGRTYRHFPKTIFGCRGSQNEYSQRILKILFFIRSLYLL